MIGCSGRDSSRHRPDHIGFTKVSITPSIIRVNPLLLPKARKPSSPCRQAWVSRELLGWCSNGAGRRNSHAVKCALGYRGPCRSGRILDTGNSTFPDNRYIYVHLQQSRLPSGWNHLERCDAPRLRKAQPQAEQFQICKSIPTMILALNRAEHLSMHEVHVDLYHN